MKTSTGVLPKFCFNRLMNAAPKWSNNSPEGLTNTKLFPSLETAVKQLSICRRSATLKKNSVPEI